MKARKVINLPLGLSGKTTPTLKQEILELGKQWGKLTAQTRDRFAAEKFNELYGASN